MNKVFNLLLFYSNSVVKIWDTIKIVYGKKSFYIFYKQQHTSCNSKRFIFSYFSQHLFA